MNAYTKVCPFWLLTFRFVVLLHDAVLCCVCCVLCVLCVLCVVCVVCVVCGE